MNKKVLIVFVILLLNIVIVNAVVDYPTHSTLYSNFIKPIINPAVTDPPTASVSTVTIDAAGKITRFNYAGYNMLVEGKTKVGPGFMVAGVEGTSYNYNFDTTAGNYLQIKSEAPGASPVVIDYAGKVGIGTTNPVVKLQVRGTTAATEVARFENSDGNSILSIQPGSVTGNTYSAIQVAISGGTTGGNLVLNPNGGNVGVGVTSPAYQLDVGGSISGIALDGSTASPDAGVIRFGDNTGWKLHFGRAKESSATSTFNSGTTGVLMTIKDNGNVGIGNTDPGSKLDVAGNVKGTGLCIGADCRTAWPVASTVTDTRCDTVGTCAQVYATTAVNVVDTNTKLERGGGNSLKVTTNSGYVEIGAQNTGWAHFTTDRGQFYFEKPVAVNGNLNPYVDANYPSGSKDLGTDANRWKDLYLNGNLCLGADCRAAWPVATAAGAETDPQVSTLTAGKWCRTSDDSASVICDKNPPLTCPSSCVVSAVTCYVFAPGSLSILTCKGQNTNKAECTCTAA